MSEFRIFVFLTLLVGVFSADKESTAGGVTTMVKGQSGKIAVYNSAGNDTTGVTITFDAIKEVDSTGADIVGGQKKHSFNNFAQLDFTFSDVTESTYGDSGVNVSKFDFNAAINEANLKAIVYIFKENGTIVVGGENVTVVTGDMKFNVEITSWPFCGGTDTCMKGQTAVTGTHLDFYIEIKGQGSATKEESSTSGQYDLGGDAKILVPKKVMFDGTTTEDMPTGYPKLEEQGGKQTFVFRFRKFTTSVLYDPVVSGLQKSADGGDGGDGGNDTEEKVKTDMVEVKVKGRSGKMDIVPKSATKSSFTIEFDNLKEIDASGAAVTGQGHSLTTFAKTDFTFGSPTDVTYQDLATTSIGFNSTLASGSVVKVMLYIFKAAGNVANGNESIAVKKGTVKFNIDISSWKFCGDAGATNCQAGVTGDKLDFEIVIKGHKDSKAINKTGTDGDAYDVGSGTVILSKMVKVDAADTFVDMAEGYPKMITQGSKKIFQFRFPKFTTSVMYDPVFVTADALFDTSGKQGMQASAFIMIAAILIQIVKRLC